MKTSAQRTNPLRTRAFQQPSTFSFDYAVILTSSTHVILLIFFFVFDYQVSRHFVVSASTAIAVEAGKFLVNTAMTALIYPSTTEDVLRVKCCP